MEPAVVAPETEQIIGTIEAVLGTFQEEGAACTDATIKADDLGALKGAVKGLIRQLQDETHARKKAEQKLKDAEPILATILPAIHDSYKIIDRDFTITFVGRPEERLFWDHQPLVGRKCYEAFHKRTAPCESCPAKEAFSTGRPGYSEAHFQSPSGQWFDLHYFPLTDTDTGEIYGALSYARDITERKKAEETLRKTEEQFQMFMQHFPGLAYIKDNSGKTIFANRGFLTFLGMDPADLIGKTNREIFPSEFAEKITRDDQRVLASGSSEIIEESFGGRTWSTHKFCINQPNGKPLLGGFTLDMSARKKVEEALAESEERFRNLMDNIPGVAVQGYKTDGTVVYWNKASEAVYGYSREEALGRNLEDLIIPEDLKPLFRQCLAIGKQARASGEFMPPGELLLLRKDGCLTPVYSMHMAVVLEGHETVLYCLDVDLTERKRAEEALRESEERFRQLAEVFPETIFEADRNGDLTYVNEHGLTRFGYTHEDIERGVNLVSAIAPEDVERVMRRVRERLDGKKGGYTEYRALCKNGKTFNALALSAPILREGQAVGIRGFILDITERKKAEEALQKSKRLFEDIIEFLPDATFVIDGDKKVIAWNRAMEEMTGVRKEDMLGQGNYAYTVPFYGERRKHLIDLLDVSDKELASKYRYVWKRGKTIFAETFTPALYGGRGAYVFAAAAALFDRQGKRVGAIESIRDITEHRRAEDALKRSEERFRQLAEMLPEGIYELDSHGRIVYANPSALKHFGYTLSDLAKGVSAADVIIPAQRGTVKANVRRILLGGETTLTEYTGLRKDGSTFPIMLHSAPVLREGKIVGARGVCFDMSRQKQLEAQLMQAQKMETVGRLAGGVAHDFNNMLTIILGYAELMKLQIHENDPLWSSLAGIENAALRSKDITTQLLAFSRKQIIAPKPLNLNKAILALGKTLSRLLGEDISLKVHAGKDVWKIKADPAQIDQVLMNLAVNARDAMPRGGKLVIETANAVLDEAYCQKHPGATPGAYVMVRVSDSGVGMDEEVLSHLFEPFFTTKEAGKGTGLGLATVYGIVKQNDGFIDVMSAPGQGSTFEIFFPRLTDEAAREELVQKAAGRCETGTVLLVEDNAMVRDITTAMLESLGHRVLAVTTPEEALTLCRKESLRIDLLLTDVVLPEMSGKELKEKLEAIRPGIKTLFMSGYPADVISRHGVLEPGTHFLQKPFKIDELREKIEETMV